MITEHFGLNEKSVKDLRSQGIQLTDLYKNRKHFDPYSCEAPVTKVSLLYYLDKHGPFIPADREHQKIAKAIFDSLDNEDKYPILEYINALQEGEF